MGRVLLIEPWYGGSHRAWADGVVRHSRHDVTLVTHPAAHWRWRLRGGAVTLAEDAAEAVAEAGPPDVVLVSGMVDVAALRTFARASIGAAPVVLYLHENQVAWPEGPARAAGDPLGWVTWTSMLASDQILLNSGHHRDVLLEGLDRLLSSAPDRSHRNRLDEVARRCSVVPVGVEVDDLLDAPRGPASGAPLVLWNQRWDADRQPERLLAILGHLADDGVAFGLALAGENRRSDPKEFAAAIDHLGERVIHVGHAPPADYRDLLLRSDVVASVSRHEYFGIGIVEAVAAGAVPVLPAALSYPEILPAWAHDSCLYRAAPAERLRSVLVGLDDARREVRIEELRQSMRRWSWTAVAPQLDGALEGVVATT